MNTLPPDHERPDDADELYRRASAQDATRPSEAVRRAVLAHADQHAALHSSPYAAAHARRAQPWRRPAAFGALAAAIVAALLVAPVWFAEHAGPGAESAGRSAPAEEVTKPAPLGKVASPPAAVATPTPAAPPAVASRATAAARNERAAATLQRQTAGRSERVGTPPPVQQNSLAGGIERQESATRSAELQAV